MALVLLTIAIGLLLSAFRQFMVVTSGQVKLTSVLSVKPMQSSDGPDYDNDV